MEMYLISSEGFILRDVLVTPQMLERANAFTNEEYAESVDFKQTLERKLLRFRDEYDDHSKEGQYVYYILRNDDGDIVLEDDSSDFKQQGTIYFKDNKVCIDAINEFKEDLIKYFNLDL